MVIRAAIAEELFYRGYAIERLQSGAEFTRQNRGATVHVCDSPVRKTSR